MVFTVQKLRSGLEALSQATGGQEYTLSPIYSIPAVDPMTPPSLADSRWQRVEVGQAWGREHGTVWLMASLQAPATMQGLPLVLQLHWHTPEDDALLLRLEATAFLDERAIGAFDWRHPVLLLPGEASDGQQRTLMLQVYTGAPLPFGGLTLRVRRTTIWRLYHMMQTLLDALLTLSEGSLARHVLLEHLNTAYTMLDLRTGWSSERFVASAHAAYEYLQAHLTHDPAQDNRPQITVSGHAHLDVGWMWPYWRTRQKIAHTIANVLGLMERYPHYYYSQSQPQLLQWLKEDSPAIYERVKEYAAEGRFEPVGAMWVESDCNLPSGESLIRQIMHGTRFLQQEFGSAPRHLWLPDAFGYNAALPQIMRGCGLPVFMTTKMSWNQFNRMPYDTFRWRGIDGSEVLAHFITAPDLHETTAHYTYNGPLRPGDMTGTWTSYQQQNINADLLYLCGWGNGGGGPTEEQLERLQIMADLPDFPQVRTGRAEDYFEALYQRVWEHPSLPTWVGELYFEYHRGTYTSQARTKQANRHAELLYRETELLNAWASIYGMPSRQEQLNQGWLLVLLNQFHDVLPGSSIREVYDDAEQVYAEACAIAEQVRDEALATLRQQIAVGKQNLLLVNTLVWERADPMQVPAQLVPHFHNRDTQQAIDWDGNTVLLLDGMRIPPCGVHVPGSATTDRMLVESSCHAAPTGDGAIILRNAYYDLCIDVHGEISHLYDKRAEREVLASGQTGNQLIAYEDRPLNFDAWDIDLFYEEKAYPLREATYVRVMEEGPVRATVEIERSYLSSRITQRLSLWRCSPRIDIATEIDWHEHQTLLKAVFPLAINSTRATYEIQFGNVERPTHRNTSWDRARFEVCAHRWADLSEGAYGVSLLNDSKYGYDIHDNVVRLTLLKSGVFPDAQAEQGLHHFTYSLLPHTGDWRDAQTVRRAYELNVPVVVLADLEHDLPHAPVPETGVANFSFVQTDCPHVVIETVKPAEDGRGLVVRLYEAHNQRGGGALTFAPAIIAAQECNLLEVPLADIPCRGNTLPFQVRPFEIKTFRVQLALAGESQL